MKVVDMHCDTILRLYDEGGNLLENEFNIDDLIKEIDAKIAELEEEEKQSE